MSKVKIEGNASGTGTLTISAPNTNTDRSLTLPDGAGEILTDASTLSSSNLSGALPAIDGSALTGISSGMTFDPDATWQDMTSSRVANTSYTNSTDYAIMVAIFAVGTSQYVAITGKSPYANNRVYTEQIQNYWATVSWIVPAGETYGAYFNTGSYTWSELRG